MNGMRDFQKLDPQSLKAFYFAAETLNFTRAAEKAALTQSGVSQHILRLEEALGTSLFIRARRKVLLTEAGSKLKAFAERYLDQVDELMESVRHEGQEVSGLVRYAMPNSCLFTPHFPMLLKDRESFEKVDLRVRIVPSESVLEFLLSGDIDFGFVTKKVNHNDLVYEEFAREQYVLVSSRKDDLKLSSNKDILSKDFVSFPGMEVLFDYWQAKLFPKSKPISVDRLAIRGEIDSLSGAITMVCHGVGMGVFPKHCVESELKSKKLYSQKTSGSENPIYIVTLRSQKPTARVQRVLKAFWAMVGS